MKKNSFVEGTIIASSAIIITKLLGIIYVIPFYSIIGEQGGALYSYAYNIYGLFLNISVAGLPIAMSKIISEYNTLGLYEAKERAFKIGRNFILIVSMICFLVLFCFSKEFAYILTGVLSEGNTIEDVSFVIKCVSFCLLIIPFLSVSKGYLQGHKFIAPTSTSQIIEQVVRIAVILLGSYITINVLGQRVSIGVGVAVLGAFAGGVVAYLYLRYKINKNKKSFNMPTLGEKDNVKSKEIIKKIAVYAVPLIIISVVTDIYCLTDLTLIIRGLTKLGYSGADAETISSIIATWGIKICIIINAISTGLSISLIPNIVSSYVKKDMEETNRRFSQAVNIVLTAALPLSIGISLLAPSIYTLFYGYSEYGSIILRYLPFTILCSSMHAVINMSLQGINKYKIIYINTILGFLVNAILDIPLMLLFEKIGIYPYYGAISATIIGFAFSFLVVFIYLKKKMKFNYSQIRSTLKKVLLPNICMIIPLLILNIVVPQSTNRLIQIPIVLFYGLFGASIYLIMTYKNGLLESVFGKQYIDNIISKFKKIFKKSKTND